MKLTISKLILYLILPLTALLTQCGSTKSIRSPTPKVPIAILISTDNSPDIFGLNDEYYTYHIMDVLDNFPEYDLVLVNYDENPEVVCNLYINNFNIWPKDERVYRRSFSKKIQSGVNAAGQPFYQTISAIAEIVQITIRSNARFATKLSIAGAATPKVYQQIFSPSYTWQNTFVRTIQGDSRAIDSSILSGSMMEGIAPTPSDPLLYLTRKQMSDRIAYEIRAYYQKEKK